MTASSFTATDIVDRVVFPTKFFGGYGKYENIHERYNDIHRALYKYTPTRRSGPYTAARLPERIIDLGARANVEIWFENKELFFHEIILEFQPQLVKNGPICPNEPFWWDFVETKYTELFEELPGLAGIICAPGTGESKVAISVNRCTCDLCKNTTMAQWYNRLVDAMYRPIHAAANRWSSAISFTTVPFTTSSAQQSRRCHRTSSSHSRTRPTTISRHSPTIRAWAMSASTANGWNSTAWANTSAGASRRPS
jgi:ribosomal protein S14